jgi:hypothetical protein
MNAMSETELTPVQASLMGIRIRIDEFEDALVADLEQLRTLVRAQGIAEADELITKMLDTLTENVGEEE